MLNFLQHKIFLLTPMVLFLLLSSFFSGAETALFSLTAEDKRQLHPYGRLRRLLTVLKTHPDELLTSILLGNLLVNILFFCTGAALSGQWAEQSGQWADAAGALIILLSVILFGEIVPKAVGVAHPRAVARLFAPALDVWFRATAPLRRFIGMLLRVLHLQDQASFCTKDLTQGELRELLDAVREEPGFGSQEKEILEDILILPEMRARQIMKPRVEIPRRNVSAAPAEMLDEIRQTGSPRLFLYKEREDDLAGYVTAADLLLAVDADEPSVAVRPVEFVPETGRADRLLNDFLSRELDVVAVVDEYGGFEGIVTPEIIFAEIAGGVLEEQALDAEKLSEGVYRLNGRLSVRSWRELFIGVLPENEAEGLAFDTLSGFIISSLGRLAVPGDQVEVRNLRLDVERVRQGRVETVLLYLNHQDQNR